MIRQNHARGPAADFGSKVWTLRAASCLVATGLLAGCASLGTPPQPAPPAGAAVLRPDSASGTAMRQTITQANQLPRTSVALPVLPSALFELPPNRLAPMLDQIDAEVIAELARFDIRDRSTLDTYSATQVMLAMQRAQWDRVPALVQAWRARQDKPAAAATTAMLSDAAAAARGAGGSLQAQRAEFSRRLAAHVNALDWAVVANTVRAQKGSLEINNPVVTVAGVRARLDPAATNAGMRLDRASVVGVLQQRSFIEHVLPFREQAVAVLADYIARHERPIADTWTPRTFSLRADAPASPVVVGVWDSGVDPALFRMASPRQGIGFDIEARPVAELLHPIDEMPLPWSQIKGFMRGARDVQSNVDSAEASAYRRHVAALQPAEVKAFQESMRLGGNYYHGTHVAGIAVQGNPFAQVFSARISFAWRTEPLAVTDERRERGKQAARASVAALRAAGARVVTMSWGGSQRSWEATLQFHGVGRDGEERRRLARQYFSEARDNLRAALAEASDILFITAAGNADVDAGFEETSPADISLPNLMTIGAVDSAGQETSFSSFGRTTLAHANGFQVDSFIPGGDRLRASGTSMAVPQVANLAAKLWALYPELSVAQVRQLILDGAERQGRVNLVHPRRSLALAAAMRPNGPRPEQVVQP